MDKNSPFHPDWTGPHIAPRAQRHEGANPMFSWLVVFGFWAFSALICLPVLIGGPAKFMCLVFLFVLIVISTYLYSSRFAGLIHRVFQRNRTI
jgi:hypothetical protein